MGKIKIRFWVAKDYPNGQVIQDHLAKRLVRLEPFGERQPLLKRRLQRLRYRRGRQIVLGLEVTVDAAMGQSRRFRQRGDAHALDSALAQFLARRGDDLLAVFLRIRPGDAHRDSFGRR